MGFKVVEWDGVGLFHLGQDRDRDKWDSCE